MPPTKRLKEYQKAVVRSEIESQVWRTIYGMRRETIWPYAMKLKYLIEKNIGGLDALKNQHICWTTVVIYQAFA